MSFDAPIRLVNASGETVLEIPTLEESSMVVSPGGLAVPSLHTFGGASRPVADSLPRLEPSRIVYGDFSSYSVVYAPPRRQGRVERALREAGRRIRLAAKMLAAGATGEEYDPDPWDE